MLTTGRKVTRRANGGLASAVLLVVGAIVLSTAAPAQAASDAKVNARLTPTAGAAGARGKAQLKLKSGARSKFVVSAAKLAPGHTFDVVVGGVKVGSFVTNADGHGHVRFSTAPHGNQSVLGFDPRGMSVSVRDAGDGDDDLVTDMPDDSPGDGACCVTGGDGETRCEDVSADACASAGGTVADAASCLPDPCGATPPSDGTVCCTNQTHDDESESECERHVSDADCAAAGGVVVQAASCHPNPCAATPPPDAVACCVTHTSCDDAHFGGGDGEDDGGEHDGGSGSGGGALTCEVRSAAACTAIGGTASGATSCDPDPCGAGSPSGAFVDGSLFL